MRNCLLSALAMALFAPLAWAKPTVATTFTVIADMAQNVAGEYADVVSITKPGAEIHEYEPTPQDLVRAQDADLILWNGMNLELWFERFFENIKDVPSVVVTEGIVTIPIASGEYEGKPNPHAWMSIPNAKIYVDNIAKALIEIDPDHREGYLLNAEAYKAQLDAMQARLEAEIALVPEGERWLATSEGAFSYLADSLGLKEAYLWPMNSEQQGSPKQIRDLIALVKAEGIPVVFSESTISPKPAQQVAKESGARYGGVLYVDSLSEPDGEVPTYLDLLDVTTRTIVKGLRGDE